MKIIPVVNCDSLACVKEKLHTLTSFTPRVSLVHVDVGERPVSSIRIPLEKRALAAYAHKFSFHLHCMVPERMFFLSAHRAKGVSCVYYEAREIKHLEKFEQQVRKWKKYGVEVGVVIAPHDALKTFVLPRGVRRVLVLAVSPGRANQKFHVGAYKVISALKERYPRVILTVDGGITPAIARTLSTLGVSAVTSSGYIWNSKNPQKGYRELLRSSKSKVKNQKSKFKVKI